VCGACGRAVTRDAWSATLGTRRGRWETATVVNELLAAQGHPARVSSGTTGWTVRSGTGAVVLADTVTEVWAAVRSVRDVDPLTSTPSG
jgi:hypothetical protein